jgi:uncharacterized SAM-binding protein YcdF (DUF218 family)
MYSLAAQVFWTLADPSRLFPAMVVVGAILLWTRWRRSGRVLVSVGALALLMVGALPVARWIGLPLEQRFPPFAATDDNIAGIIVLGAGYAIVSDLTGFPVVEASGGRLIKLIELAAAYPQARLAYTGGGSPTLAMSEADRAARDLARVGFDTGRVIFEGRSRDTYQNAVFTKEMLSPRPGERWVIITSGIHMPRAVGAFRAAGWEVVPAPVELLFRRESNFDWGSFHPVRQFPSVSRITHEWIGLVVYRLLGRSSELFPG